MAKQGRRELLIVDGYNVIFATPRYQELVDEDGGEAQPSRLGNDVHTRSRQALIADVAAFAAGRYRPVIVFDGGGNKNAERPSLHTGGVELVFSRPGQEADELIEELVVEARLRDEDVTLITSDNTVQATVGGVPVTRLSSQLLVHEVSTLADEREQLSRDTPRAHMTIEDRISPEARAKLNELLGR